MVNIPILYTGDISPMRINANDSIYDRWVTGEVREIDERDAKKLLKDNPKVFKVQTKAKPVELPKEIVKKDRTNKVI